MNVHIHIYFKKPRICPNTFLSAQKGVCPYSIMCYQFGTRSTAAGHTWTWHWQQRAESRLLSAGPLPACESGCCGTFHICGCLSEIQVIWSVGTLRKVTETEISLKVACEAVLLNKPWCWMHFPPHEASEDFWNLKPTLFKFRFACYSFSSAFVSTLLHFLQIRIS